MKFYIFAILFLEFHFLEAEILPSSPFLIPPIGNVLPQYKINTDGLEDLSAEETYRKIYFQTRKMKPFQEQIIEAKAKFSE